MTEMEILVAYDVMTETAKGRRRLRRVAQVCTTFGQRVQKSVFECSVNEMQYERLKHALLGIINKEEDSLRLYRLPPDKDRCVEHFGIGGPIDFHGPLVA